MALTSDKYERQIDTHHHQREENQQEIRSISRKWIRGIYDIECRLSVVNLFCNSIEEESKYLSPTFLIS